jgi:hypothetical protein
MVILAHCREPCTLRRWRLVTRTRNWLCAVGQALSQASKSTSRLLLLGPVPTEEQAEEVEKERPSIVPVW